MWVPASKLVSFYRQCGASRCSHWSVGCDSSHAKVGSKFSQINCTINCIDWTSTGSVGNLGNYFVCTYLLDRKLTLDEINPSLKFRYSQAKNLIFDSELCLVQRLCAF